MLFALRWLGNVFCRAACPAHVLSRCLGMGRILDVAGWDNEKTRTSSVPRTGRHYLVGMNPLDHRRQGFVLVTEECRSPMSRERQGCPITSIPPLLHACNSQGQLHWPDGHLRPASHGDCGDLWVRWHPRGGINRTAAGFLRVMGGALLRRPFLFSILSVGLRHIQAANTTLLCRHCRPRGLFFRSAEIVAVLHAFYLCMLFSCRPPPLG